MFTDTIEADKDRLDKGIEKGIHAVKQKCANDNKDKLNIILGKIHDDTTVEMLEQTFRTAKLNFLSVEKLTKE